MNAYKYHIVEQPLGWMGLLGTERGLRRLSLKPSPQEALDELGPALEQAVHEPNGFDAELACLERYFRGESGALDEIQLDLEDAPPFFKSAWPACRSIPPGETRSYGWLAAAAGRPQAARAAGQAMARNRVVLVIPCHRVIGGNGDLHGYGAGGLQVKADLLAMERGAALAPA
jgi:methylated-DNA-[protein]-cysteine S-methyltransferase